MAVRPLLLPSCALSTSVAPGSVSSVQGVEAQASLPSACITLAPAGSVATCTLTNEGSTSSTGSGGSFGDCTGFTSENTDYSGTLAGFDLQEPDGGDWAEAAALAEGALFETGDVRDAARIDAARRLCTPSPT